MFKPIVSVLMTAFNREKYIAAAIESVLKSTLADFELIISDDCSTDRTVEIVKSYAEKDSRIKLFINEKNLGDYPNRNMAASYASGKYLKYLDSDDIMYPHCLQVMVTAMEKFPVAGFGLSANSDPNHFYPVCITPHDAYMEHFWGYGHFDRAPGSSIIKKEAFKEVKGFSGKRMIGDSELWFTLSRFYSLVKLPRDLIWDRVHQYQESKTEFAKQYPLLRKSIISEALKHPDCPLSKEEIKKIRESEKKRKLKQILKNGFKL